MTEPRSKSSNVYQGCGHFEFSSEKNWGVEQEDCKIFDSIDITHLADSISSVPFNIRHNLPIELFTVEQLEEFEVEASLALSRHTFQCNSKLSKKTVMPTKIECNQVSETDKLMKLILNNFSSSEENNVLDCKIQSNEQLDAILGNMKPLMNILQNESNTDYSLDDDKNDSKKVEDQIMTVKITSEAEVTNHDSGHWLDSMLDSDE